MEVKTVLEQLVAEPIKDAETAERVSEAADLLAAYHRLAEQVIQLTTPSSEVKTTESLSGLPLHEAAERVLEEAGSPLHARELGSRIKAGGWRHPRSRVARPEQIVHQLAARLPRYPQTFRRVAPQTFALTKWGDDSFPGARVGIEPRVGLFRGPGDRVARKTESSDEVVASEAAAWRSS